jgi:methionyl-tRNA synthetase
MTQRRILVTSALPYANGPIHIGHLVEYIQTDIWVRFQKLRGHRCIYVCADDTHGTAIMIRARREGRSEVDLIASMKEAHQRDFAGFGIEFDNYGSTNDPENRELCGQFWTSMREAGLIVEHDVEQLFDPEAKTFLADRFVRGTCPKCKALNQPGDNCSVCGATYSPAELVDPKSTLSGAVPELKSAKHLFVELQQLHGFLSDWVVNSGALQSETANYLKGHFLANDLRDWDISRPAPYFGFEIPDSPGNYWYVWFDAPIGYVASTAQWCKEHGEALADWWQSDDTEIHHFIGKDITYFHTLFWPGMLKSAGFSLPTKVRIHGFLNVGGQKMSKSQGTLITAEKFLERLDPSYLRYFYATKLTSRVEDLDLGIDEFAEKVNADLVGKVVNLASRTAKFAHSTGLAHAYPEDGGLFASAAKAGDAIADAYESCDYSRAMRLIMELADAANPFIEHAQPWVMKKDAAREDELRDVCTVGLNLFRQLCIYLAPVLPRLAEQCGELLGDKIERWEQSREPLLGSVVLPFKHMMTRVNPEDLLKMIEESREEPEAEASAGNANAEPSTSTSQWNDGPGPLMAEPLAEEITIEDLLKLKLSLGGDQTRQVFAGIKAAYDPEQLVGRLVVMVANLKPRQMKFGLSEGMVTASGPGGEEVFLLGVDEGAQPGMRVH